MSVKIRGQGKDKERDNFRFISAGSSGTDISGGIFSEEYLRELTGMEAADIFDEMRRSDDQLRMLTRMVKNPIVSASWDIQTVNDSEEEKNIRDFTRHVLFENIGNPRTGKIKTWTEFIQEAMSFIEFGYSVFEITHKIVIDDPRFGDYIGLKDLGWRSPRTIFEWNLRQDGSIDNIRQIVSSDLQRDVTIDGQFLLALTPNKEGDNYEGISDFRPIYGNWKRKQWLRKAQMIGIERSATGIPIGTIPAGKIDSPEETVFRKSLQSLVSHQNSYLIVPEGFGVETLKTSHDADKVSKAIDQENVGMTKSFLANFLELGMGKGGGAYALGADLSDLFLNGIEFYSDLIVDTINRKLVTSLVKAKFGAREKYPLLSVSGISEKMGKEFSEVLEKLTVNGLIQKSDKLKSFIHKTYKLPDFIEEDAESEINTGLSDTISLSEVQSLLFDKNLFIIEEALRWASEHDFKTNKIDETEKNIRIRQIDPALFERFVTKEIDNGVFAIIGFRTGESDFDDVTRDVTKHDLAENKNISGQIDKESETLLKLSQVAWRERIDKHVINIMNALRNLDKQKARSKIKRLIIPGPNAHKLEITRFFAPLIESSSQEALRELGLLDIKLNEIDESNAPFDAREAANDRAGLLLETEGEDINKVIDFTINTNITTSNLDQLETQIRKVTDEYLTGPQLAVASTNSVSALVNIARNAVFQTKEVLGEIESFIFTNPSPVSAICEELTGRVFTKSEYITSDRLPPLHHNCKSYVRAQRTGRKGNRKINPIGLQFTGTAERVEAIIKSKRF